MGCFGTVLVVSGGDRSKEMEGDMMGPVIP